MQKLTSTKISEIIDFIEEIITIDTNITQLPRGRWEIDFTVGQKPDLFENRKTVKFHHKIIFESVFKTITKFLARERIAIDALLQGLIPLQTILQQNPSQIQQNTTLQIDAISALKTYNIQMETHPNHIDTIKTELDRSLLATKDTFLSFLETQSAGKSTAQILYNGYESQIKHTVTKMESVFIKRIPELYNTGIQLLDI